MSHTTPWVKILCSYRAIGNGDLLWYAMNRDVSKSFTYQSEHLVCKESTSEQQWNLWVYFLQRSKYVKIDRTKQVVTNWLKLWSSHLVRYECIEFLSWHSRLQQLLPGLSPSLASHQSLRLGQEIGQQNLQWEIIELNSARHIIEHVMWCTCIKDLSTYKN